MNKFRSWAQHYRAQDPNSSHAALCDQWADYHQALAVELGNRSKAAYNGQYTANQTTTVPDAAWTAVNTDQGTLQSEVPPADGRPYDQRGGLRRPLQQHQDDLAAAMPRNPDGSLVVNPDPRVGGWFGLANDGGPSFDGARGVNCLDCMISAWRTWRGTPQVSAPRTLDAYAGTNPDAVANGETGGMARAAATVGGQWQTVFPNLSAQPTAQAQQWSDWGFATIAHQLQTAGEGSAMFIVTEWQGGGSHAWLAVNQGGTILFLDPQTNRISENVSMYGHSGNPADSSNVVGLRAIMLDPNGDPQPIAALAQTPWGQQAQQAQQPNTQQQAPVQQSQPVQQQTVQGVQQAGPSFGQEQAGRPAEAGDSLPEPGRARRPRPQNPPPGAEGHHIFEEEVDHEAIPLYAQIRALTDAEQRIAAHLSIPEEVVARARRNLFLQVHENVAVGTDRFETGHFTAIMNIAEDWLAAYNGTMDEEQFARFRIDIAHEYIESMLMERLGMPYRPSHIDYWEANEWSYPTATPEHFGAHDLAPSPSIDGPFATYASMGLEEPRVSIASDLSNLDEVVDEIIRRVRHE